MGITSADGTVRTQAGVKLQLAGSVGMSTNQLDGVRNSLATPMAAVRSCFAQAMSRSPGVDGSVIVELTSPARGRVQARIKQNNSSDPVMAECMRSALSTSQTRSLPQGAKVEATLMVNNPIAKLRAQQAQRSVLKDVRMLSGGLAESSGGTAANEVGYRVAGSAYASQTIGELNQQLLTRLPGLLDCRRKSSRRTRTAEGKMSIDLSIDAGKISNVRTVDNSMNDRRAAGCITAWLQRVDASQLATADLSLTVSFTHGQH